MDMKTTFDLPEALVADVKRIAKERGVTAREIVTQALTRVVEEQSPKPFKLKDGSFKGGQGLAPEWANATWAEILEDSYGDRW